MHNKNEPENLRCNEYICYGGGFNLFLSIIGIF